MIEYTCPRCHYKTNIKSNLKRHLKGKQVCDTQFCSRDRFEILEEMTTPASIAGVCDLCQKNFKSRLGYKQHMGKIHGIPDVHEEDPRIEQLTRMVITLQEQVQYLTSPNQNIQTNNHIQTQTNNQTNIQTNIQNQQNNIIINAFGKEDISYITNHPNVKNFLTKIMRMKDKGICEYLSKKHFHPDHPENHNIRRLNKKDKMIEYHDGKKWRPYHKEDIVDQVIGKIALDFRKFVEDHDFKDSDVNCLMSTVGEPLDWDLNCDKYKYDDDAREFDPESEDDTKNKDALKNRLYMLFFEHIYQESKYLQKLGSLQ